MQRRPVTRLIAAVSSLLAAAVLGATGATAQPAEAAPPVDGAARADGAALVGEVVRLLEAGRFQDAGKLTEQAVALALAEAGERGSLYADALTARAKVRQRLNETRAAEEDFTRALAVREALLADAAPGAARGAAVRSVVDAFNNLALLVRAQSARRPEAEALLKRAIELHGEAVPRPRGVLVFTHEILAGLYSLQNRFKEAEEVLGRAIAMQEQDLGPDHFDIARNRASLGRYYREQGQYAAAEATLKASLAGFEKAQKAEHPDIVGPLDILTGLYRLTGRLTDALPHQLRAVAIRLRTAPEHPDTARALGNLALLQRDMGEHREAEAGLERAVAIREKSLGPEHPDLIESLDALGGLYRIERRFGIAEPYLKRALDIRLKRLGPDDAATAESMRNYALVLADLDRLSEAEDMARRGIAVTEQRLGADHPSLTVAYSYLAALHTRQGNQAAAETELKRAIALSEKALGLEHPTTAASYHNLAAHYFQQRQWEAALAYYDKSTTVHLTRRQQGGGQRELQSIAALSQRQGTTEVAQHRDRFVNLVRTAWRVAEASPARAKELREKAYAAAQWALMSDAAGALAQMAARLRTRDKDMARLVRAHQDLAGAWRDRDRELVRLLANPARRSPAQERDEQGFRRQLAEIEGKFETITEELRARFPDYFELTRPAALSIGETQQRLREGEVLYQLVAAGSESFAWAVTRRDVRWARLDIGRAKLAEHVAALRCGLDHSAWRQGEACTRFDLAYSVRDQEDGRPLPFDLGRAHALYRALLAPFADMLRGRQMIVVPPRELASLPFAVLVAEPPKVALPAEVAAYSRTAWLGRRLAHTVLPSISSLVALRPTETARRARVQQRTRQRQVAAAGPATRPYLGIGNPLLDGRPAISPDDAARAARDAERAALARSRQDCATRPAPRDPDGRARILVAGANPSRGATADIDIVRQWSPLPETADELCEVARQLGSGRGEVMLGARAREGVLKELSDNGRLAEYAVLHFATHGALSGRVAGSSEAGLILTPPDKAAAATATEEALERDDGYLTTSEIAALQLNADWVVLSACNTAAGDETSAEALSGLARAFFYAGARSVLASHWDVDSKASVMLTTKAFAEYRRNPRIGRAEAMRRSMAELAARRDFFAHPVYWAPFAVVGEGSGSAPDEASPRRAPRPTPAGIP